MLTLSAAIAFVNFNEDLRQKFRDRFVPDIRVVVAKSSGDLVGGGRSFTVLKVKNKDSLAVEVFENNYKTKQALFRARAILPEHRDAYFSYMGVAVNLLLLDVKGDGVLDIVTAAFDENLIPRMHVYKLNDVTGTLDPLGPEAIKF
jgi:hypothetical protein